LDFGSLINWVFILFRLVKASG